MKLIKVRNVYTGTVWEIASESNRNRVHRGNAGRKFKRK